MTKLKHVAFKTPSQLDRWLKTHHKKEAELWVRIYKKGSGVASVTWSDCVVLALRWGWIDGLKRALDDESHLQRFTPRRPKSTWSKINCEHAERLIAEGRMQSAGFVHVQAAKNDGRWERAYAGSKNMVIPSDFLKSLRRNPAAKKFYATLDRSNLYAIYHRLQTATTDAVRAKRIASIVERLATGTAFH